MNKNFLLTSLIIFSISTTAFAGGPFSLMPNGVFPTKVYRGDTVTARYTITNLSSRELDNCSVESHPSNTAIASEGCGQRFNLKSHESCTLTLNVSGEVNNFPVLFICDSFGTGCSGNGDHPLLVHAINNVPSLVLTTPGLPKKIIDGDVKIYSYKLTSTGSAATEPIQISLSGPGHDGITLVNDQCSGKELTPNGVCTFDVKLLPQDDDVSSGINQVITIDYGDA